VATFVPFMFYDFYSVKNKSIVKNSATNEAGEKISADLESLEF
jgi:hypothetical protein